MNAMSFQRANRPGPTTRWRGELSSAGSYAPHAYKTMDPAVPRVFSAESIGVLGPAVHICERPPFSHADSQLLRFRQFGRFVA
jgi:hypothetical protein